MRDNDDDVSTMGWQKRVEVLLAVIGQECNRRMARDHEFGVHEVAEWLIDQKREQVMNGLVGLIGQAQDRFNDDYRARAILRRRPDLAEPDLAKAMRQVSRALGVGYWYLLSLEDGDKKKLQQCFAAAQLIYRLQAEEAQAEADAMLAVEEMIEPVVKDNPQLTLDEAMEEMKRRTDQTIRGLEDGGGKTACT
jgi:hypothetical protein